MNYKSLINKETKIVLPTQEEGSVSSKTVKNLQFHRKLWLSVKYLQDPTVLISTQSKDQDFTQLQSEVSNAKKEQSKLEIFLELVQ